MKTFSLAQKHKVLKMQNALQTMKKPFQLSHLPFSEKALRSCNTSIIRESVSRGYPEK